MKSMIFSILILALGSISAQGTVTSELTCKFKNNVVKGEFIVAMNHLENPLEAELAEIYSDYDGESTAFSFDGTEDMEWYWYLLRSWDNGYEFDAKGDFNLYLDSDGCDVGILKLYKNNGYRYGYTRVEHRCSGDVPNTFDLVRCSVKTK